MSFEVRKNTDGEMFVLPLELPIFDGDPSGLEKQSEICLASALRHAAVCDWISSNLDESDPVVQETYDQEHAQLASQLASLFMSLAGIADSFEIDIMQEIWDMPWEV